MTNSSLLEAASKAVRWPAICFVLAASCGDVSSDLISGAERPSCKRDDECSVDRPVCEIASGRCTGCSADGACGAGRPPRCDTITGACVECLTNADCSGDRRICDTAGHRCVECLTDGHCSDVGERCSVVLGSCAVPCASDAPCPPGDPFCDVPVGFCVECQTDRDCAASNLTHCRDSHCTR